MRPFVLSFVFGLIAACALPQTGPLAMAGIPAPLPFAAFAAGLSGLFFLLRGGARPPRAHASLGRARAFGYGYAWAFGYFLLSLSWIGNALLIEGNPYAWAYPLALVGLPFLLSFYLGIACAAGAPLVAITSKTRAAFAFIAIFTLAEFARGYMLTGFPWNLLAFVWSDTLPIFQSLSVLGPYGLTFLTLLWALGPTFVLADDFPKGRGITLAAAVTLGAVFIYGYVQLAPSPSTDEKALQAVLVQANIPQSEKWDGTKMVDHFYNHLERSRAPEGLKNIPTLIIWPETALPPAYLNAPAVRRGISAILKGYPTGSWLVTGVLRADGGAFYNGMAAFDAQGQMQVLYDKHHLVPFGEYMPFQSYIPIGPITRFEGLAAGPGPKTVTLKGIPPFSPLVCYEVIFGSKVRAKDAVPPDFMLNVTNDSWYGNSAGPHQHLAQARARAIEQGIPLLRSAETGISAAIDSKGRLIETLPYGRDGSRLIYVNYTNTSFPPYQLYGDFLILTLVLGVLFLVVFRARN